jgi:hypothetical protein
MKEPNMLDVTYKTAQELRDYLQSCHMEATTVAEEELFMGLLTQTSNMCRVLDRLAYEAESVRAAQ